MKKGILANTSPADSSEMLRCWGKSTFCPNYAVWIAPVRQQFFGNAQSGNSSISLKPAARRASSAFFVSSTRRIM